MASASAISGFASFTNEHAFDVIVRDGIDGCVGWMMQKHKQECPTQEVIVSKTWRTKSVTLKKTITSLKKTTTPAGKQRLTDFLKTPFAWPVRLTTKRTSEAIPSNISREEAIREARALRDAAMHLARESAAVPNLRESLNEEIKLKKTALKLVSKQETKVQELQKTLKETEQVKTKCEERVVKEVAEKKRKREGERYFRSKAIKLEENMLACGENVVSKEKEITDLQEQLEISQIELESCQQEHKDSVACLEAQLSGESEVVSMQLEDKTNGEFKPEVVKAVHKLTSLGVAHEKVGPVMKA